jgi:N-acetylneuraminic acid mutarotase
MAAASLRGKLYVVGVDDNREMAVECFDPYTSEWHRQPPVPRQRFGCAAATVAGALHVIGGHDGQQPVATVERFNAATGWETLPELPTARHGCAAACVGGLLYVVGGDDNKSMMDAAERYNPKTKCWEKLKYLPTGRFGCAAAAAWQ